MDVVGLFAGRGAHAYGERVTQLQHALQCAAQAQRDRADDELVVAALLHDVGHLLEDDGGAEAPGRNHGTLGAGAVRPHAPARVAWLIEHHVVAKRYLVTVDARYVEALSPASRRSLVQQGAVLDVADAVALETQPWFADAVRLRRWDDAAKRPDAVVPPLAAYGRLLERWFGAQAWCAMPGIDR